MTNDELKKKIVDEINKHQLFGGRFGYKGELMKFPNELLADALIAAWIGDIKEAEHRAEVAERALRNRARQYVDLQGYSAWEVAILAAEFVVPNDLKQAEKELAEENGGKKEV